MAILDDKTLVGIMPHFRYHVKVGELAIRPNMIEFNKLKSIKQYELWYEYDVDDWSRGVLHIINCRPVETKGEGLLAETFDLDKSYNKSGCRFTIEKEVMGYIEAKGNLEIRNGKLIFKNTEWPRAEQKNDHFLEKDSSLGIERDGSLVGSMTYLGSSGLPEVISFNKVKKNKHGFSFPFITNDKGEGYTDMKNIKRNLKLILCRKS